MSTISDEKITLPEQARQPIDNEEAERQPRSSLEQAATEPQKQQIQHDRQNQEPPYSVFTTWQKRILVLSAAGTAFFSPLSAQIYLPALTTISKDLNVSNTQVNLTITTYMIFQGITPMFIGSLADSGGRRPAYILCFIIYIAANIGLALAPGFGAVLGLRCLQSAGSSSTVAICMAVVADIVTSAERGKYIGYTVVPIVLAPALGPVIGGLLSQYLGWRSIFWFLTIAAGLTLTLLFLFFPETCRPIVGNGSIVPSPIYQTGWQMLTQRQRRSKMKSDGQTLPAPREKRKFKPPNILGSLVMLLQKETGLLLVASGIVFAGFYCLAAAMPTLFKEIYGYNDIEVGLMYLPMAIGSIGAAVIGGPAMTWNYKRHCAKLGIPYERTRQQDLSDFPIEAARLQVGTPLMCLAGITLVAWGWTMQARTHVAAPCVLSALVGVGMIGYNNTTNTLLVDIHPGQAGTATAANNFTRCLIGAGASAAIVPLNKAIGVGPAFTIVGGLYLSCVIAQLVLISKGMKWRRQEKAKQERKKQVKEEKHENKRTVSSSLEK